MAILPIRVLGDPVLRERSRPVERFDRTLRRLAEDMLETMYGAPGVGLAANQVGFTTACFVYDDGDGHKGFVANPEVSGLEEEETHDEGCLSIPGPFYPTLRALRVRLTGPVSSSLANPPQKARRTPRVLLGGQAVPPGRWGFRGPPSEF